MEAVGKNAEKHNEEFLKTNLVNVLVAFADHQISVDSRLPCRYGYRVESFCQTQYLPKLWLRHQLGQGMHYRDVNYRSILQAVFSIRDIQENKVQAESPCLDTKEFVRRKEVVNHASHNHIHECVDPEWCHKNQNEPY
jgi:hypothetical protein